MQNGRREPRMPVMHDRLADSSPSDKHAREVRVWMGSDTDDFMALDLKTVSSMAPNPKTRYWQNFQYWSTFLRALRSAASRVKSHHVSVIHG
jgi:hypothetical protein